MRIFTFFAGAALAALCAQAAPAGMPVQHKAKIMKQEVGFDDIIYETPEGVETWYNRSCDGFRVDVFSAVHGPVLGSVIKMVETEDGDVYLNHIASEYPIDTWVKASKEGNTLTIEGVQPIYMEYDYDLDEDIVIYVAPMHVVVDEDGIGTFVVTDDQKFVFNILEDGTLEAADPEMLLGVCVESPDEKLSGNDAWIWKGFGDRDIKLAPFKNEPLVLPDNLTFEDWVWTDEFESAFVSVAVDGDDFYISGMNRSLPDAWIKGKIEGDKVTFPSGQYMGANLEIFYYNFFCGAKFTMGEDEDGEEIRMSQLTDAAVFNYDPVNKCISPVADDLGYVINATASVLYPLYSYQDVKVGMQHRNPDTAPAAPYDLEYIEQSWGNAIWFQLPNTDEEGNLLNEKKLFYEIYIDGNVEEFVLFDEEGEEYQTSKVPYNYDDWFDFWVEGIDHTVYLYTPMEHNIGVRSIYINENGVEIPSKMAYYGNVSVGALDEASDIVGTSLFDMQGHPVGRNFNGPAVKVTTHSDGTVTRTKVMNR